MLFPYIILAKDHTLCFVAADGSGGRNAIIEIPRFGDGGQVPWLFDIFAAHRCRVFEVHRVANVLSCCLQLAFFLEIMSVWVEELRKG